MGDHNKMLLLNPVLEKKNIFVRSNNCSLIILAILMKKAVYVECWIHTPRTHHCTNTVYRAGRAWNRSFSGKRRQLLLHFGYLHELFNYVDPRTPQLMTKGNSLYKCINFSEYRLVRREPGRNGPIPTRASLNDTKRQISVTTLKF